MSQHHLAAATEVIQNPADFPPAMRGCALCIGNFDGVHLGHARMLAAGRQMATRHGLPFVIMTFEPHPMTILKPEIPRLPIMTLDQRLETLREFKPDGIILITTNKEFLGIDAQDFMDQSLHTTLDARWLVEGENFTFGRGALGTVRTLRENEKRFGWQTIVVPTVQASLDDKTVVNVSSSMLRWLLGHGRVRDAQTLLGRPYALRGRVEHGEKRGRLMGYPTVNPQVRQILPADGVYGGWAKIGSSVHRAAISVGTNPTFQGNQRRVEAFLLDFDHDVYEKTVELQFGIFVRDQQAFPGPETLREQISRDVKTILRTLPEKPIQPLRETDIWKLENDQAVQPTARI